jgi:transposase
MRRTIWIGIDVAKDKLDVAVKRTEAGERPGPPKRAQEAWISANTDKGVAELVRRVQALAPERIILEATGGYEQRAFLALRAAGLPAVIVPPGRVRAFAEGIGRDAKTDPIDALVLAYFGEVRQPEVLPLPTENQKRVSELGGLRADLVATKTAYQNRLEHASPENRTRIERLLEVVTAQIDELDKELVKALKSTPERKRFVRGGRRALRSLLHMAALSAKVHNPAIRAFAERLEAAGKPFHAVMTACVRKLIVILNAIVASGTPWSPTP